MEKKQHEFIELVKHNDGFLTLDKDLNIIEINANAQAFFRAVFGIEINPDSALQDLPREVNQFITRYLNLALRKDTFEKMERHGGLVYAVRAVNSENLRYLQFIRMNNISKFGQYTFVRLMKRKITFQTLLVIFAVVSMVNNIEHFWEKYWDTKNLHKRHEILEYSEMLVKLSDNLIKVKESELEYKKQAQLAYLMLEKKFGDTTNTNDVFMKIYMEYEKFKRLKDSVENFKKKQKNEGKKDK